MALTSVANVKVKMGITDSSQDTLLTALVAQASRLIKTWCRRELEEASYTEYPRGYGTRHLRLVQRPVVSITTVWLDSRRTFASGTELVVDVDYKLVNGRLLRLNGVWPAALENKFGLLASAQVPSDGIIKVTYTAGYSTVPDDLVLAADLLVAKLMGMSEEGSDLLSERLEDHSYTRATPAGEQAALDGLLADITPLLRPYRRIRA